MRESLLVKNQAIGQNEGAPAGGKSGGKSE